MSLRIVCISDSHLAHDEYELAIPEGDILIHAGDFTFKGYPHEINSFSKWLYALPHPVKIVCAGNHDLLFEDEPARALAHLQGCNFIEDRNKKVCTYLQDSEITIDGLRIYCSPWQPRFFDWAFNLDRGPAIKAKWDKIPDGIDILVTHGPPYGYGDLLPDNERVGCEDLLEAVKRVKPKLHIFGHIHCGYGTYRIIHNEQENIYTTAINASICDEAYHPAHRPIIIDYDQNTKSIINIDYGKSSIPMLPNKRSSGHLW